MIVLEAPSDQCFICWNEGRLVPAVAICGFLQHPVCEVHAEWCRSDGHQLEALK